MELRKFSIAAPLLLAAAIAPGLRAQTSDSLITITGDSYEETEELVEFEQNMDMGDVIALFREQQREIAAQRKLLEEQSRKIDTLTTTLATLQATQAQPAPRVKSDTAVELAAQKRMLQQQSQQITALKRELNAVKTAPANSSDSVQIAESHTEAVELSPTATPAPVEQPTTASEKETATGEAVAQAQEKFEKVQALHEKMFEALEQVRGLLGL